MREWEKPSIDEQKVLQLASLHKINTLTATILTRRQMDQPEKIAFFLEEDERFLHNPFLFPQMEKAVERVLEAAEQNEKILVCGDKDADGITATVLMLETLQSLGLDPLWRVPIGDEDYGLSPEVLKEHAAQDVTLLITVDCGISEFDEIQLAGQLGMDVLVFDHHLPHEGNLPDAYGLINPKISGNYPFEGLCAAAVVSKFQWAICLAQTEFWNQDYCLLYADSAGDTITMEALRIRHFREVSRLTASMDSELHSIEKFIDFIQGQYIFIYDKAIQIPLISRFFGGAQINAADLKPMIGTTFPALKGMNVAGLEAMSRLGRYFPDQAGPAHTLANLAVTLQAKNNAASFDLWRKGLDLTVIGTIADMMPLTDENRILVRLGLKRLNAIDNIKERRIALRELLIRLKLHDGQVNAVNLSWQVCPLINASGRMGRADLGVQMLLTKKPDDLKSLMDQIFDLNKQRRSLVEQLWDKTQAQARQSAEDFDGRMSIVWNENIPRGVTGIMSHRLHKALNTISVVISIRDKEASGSIRCGQQINAMDWLKSMEDLLVDFGGHPQAGGFSLPVKNIDPLIKLSQTWIAQKNTTPAPLEKLQIDAELSHDEYSKIGRKGLIPFLDQLEPYGQGFEPLKFLTRSVKIVNAELVGKPNFNHLKLQVILGNEEWTALWWDAAGRYGQDIRINMNVDLIYYMDKDRWRGVETQRLTVLEAIPCTKQTKL